MKIPEPVELGMDFDMGWDGVKAWGYTESQMLEFRIDGIVEVMAQYEQMPEPLIREALKLSEYDISRAIVLLINWRN